MSAITAAGNVALNANITLGNASGDDLTITASLASSISIKTTNTYDFGSATIGLRSLYLADAGSAARSTRILGATVASSWTLTLPTSAGTNRYILQTNGSGVTSWVSLADIAGGDGTTSATAGSVGEYVESVVSGVSVPTLNQYGDITSISLTAGDWDVTGMLDFTANGASIVQILAGISTTSGNSGTGLVAGSNQAIIAPATASYHNTAAIPNWRLLITSTTTVYLKANLNYSAATPTAAGRLSARRVR